MTSIALSAKAAKLMKLCDAAGFDGLADLLAASMRDSVCPAICMTKGCDYTTDWTCHLSGARNSQLILTAAISPRLAVCCCCERWNVSSG